MEFTPLIEGVLAGYGIAVPVGAIAILIIDLGIRRGFVPALMAAAGAASADLVYASLAALAGASLAAILAPYSAWLGVASAIVLLAIGGMGLWRLRDSAVEGLDEPEAQHRTGTIYLQFLGLTLLNPLTIAYFGALILGRSGAAPLSSTERLLFVLGAAVASFSWQVFLALISSSAGRRLSPSAQRAATIAGNLIVIGFGLRIALGLLQT